MGIEVRSAEPGDAEAILLLINQDLARRGLQTDTEIDDNSVAKLANRIERNAGIHQIVAIGRRGISAYARFGAWEYSDENQFASGWFERRKNELREYMGEAGLFTFAVDESYSHPAAQALVEETGIFDVSDGQKLNIPVIGAGHPSARPLEEFLSQQGAAAEQIGLFATAEISQELQPAELWAIAGKQVAQ